MLDYIHKLFKRKPINDYLYEVSKGAYYDSIVVDLNTFFHQTVDTHNILQTNVLIVFNETTWGSFIPKIKSIPKNTWFEEKKILNKKYEIAFTKSSMWGSKVRSQMHVYDSRFFLGSHLFYSNKQKVLTKINEKYGVSLNIEEPAIIYDQQGNGLFVLFGTTVKLVYFEQFSNLTMQLMHGWDDATLQTSGA